MALAGSKKDAVVAANINVTPMIDVMLVLLIIFMIVTPAITAGFQATVPRAMNPESREEQEGEIRLGIDKDGKFFLDITDPRTGKYRAALHQRRGSPRAAGGALRQPDGGQDPVPQGGREHRLLAGPGSHRDRPQGRRSRDRRHCRAAALGASGDALTWRWAPGVRGAA